jgi:hypothetical protein
MHDRDRPGPVTSEGGKLKRVRPSSRAIIALMAFAVLGGAYASTILAANEETTIRAGNLVIRAQGTISPTALPKNRMAQITLHARGSVATADGSHVPPAKTVHLQIDRHFRIETSGLPRCQPGEIEAATPSQAMKACGKALIGKGVASAEVEFPESAPFSARGPLLGFNGPTVGGYGEMLYYVYVSVPAPTALVVIAKVAKDSGKYAYSISLTVPALAGGSGSLTGFEITIGRKWTHEGEQHSYLNADCPNGIFLNKVEAAFGDGTNLVGVFPDSCQSKG